MTRYRTDLEALRHFVLHDLSIPRPARRKDPPRRRARPLVEKRQAAKAAKVRKPAKVAQAPASPPPTVPAAAPAPLPLRWTPEGLEKRCRHCGEWWPAHTEFFYRDDRLTKHVMASALREAFAHGRAAMPYVDTGWDGEDPDWLALVRQLGNIKAVPTRASYSSFQMADAKLGDDLFDAACAGVYAIATRGLADAPVVVATRQQSREALLGSTLALPR